ncbi:MAG TPA: hypothetical protein ENH33_05070 [Actinobacteria bacterium]|nr:hypothetical protein [Actinomycetota bacterium]
MTGLLLIRHAVPTVESGVPAAEWSLSPEGREAARVLAERIDAGSCRNIATSDEVKAVETAEAVAAKAGGVIVVDSRLREASRPWTRDGYEVAARRWLVGDGPDGWEPRRLVVERMSEAIGDSLVLGGSTSVVVSHGLAIAAFVAAVAGVDPVRFWSDLRFPDAWWVDSEGTHLARFAG